MWGYSAVARSVVAFVGGVALTLGLVGQARAADGPAAVPWYAKGRPVPAELATVGQGVAIDDALPFGPHYLADRQLAAMIAAGELGGGTYEQRPDGVSREGQPPSALLDGWGSADERWVQTVKVTAPEGRARTITLRVSTDRFYFGDGSLVSRTRVEAPHGDWPRNGPPLGKSYVYRQGPGPDAPRVAMPATKGVRDPYRVLVDGHNYVRVQAEHLGTFTFPIVNTSMVGKRAERAGLFTEITTEFVNPRRDPPRTPAAQRILDRGLYQLGRTEWVARTANRWDPLIVNQPMVAQCSQCFALIPLAGGEGALAALPISERLFSSLRQPPPAEAREALAANAQRAREQRGTQRTARRPYRR